MLRSWGSTPAARRLLYFFTDVHSDTVDADLAVLAGNGDEALGRQHFIDVRLSRSGPSNCACVCAVY
jgi:hypothetical protein